MLSFSAILITFLTASGTVYSIAVPAAPAPAPAAPPQTTPINPGDKGLSPFMRCAMALPNWPNANKDAIKKCADENRSTSHKRDIIIDARYAPGDYTKCLEAIPGYPHNYDTQKAALCAEILPSQEEAAGSTLKPRDASSLLGVLGEYLSPVCPVDASSTINWTRFMTASTLKGWANTICSEAVNAPLTNGNQKHATDNKHGLRKIGITYAMGPQVQTVLTLLDYGLDFFKVKDEAVKYCVDAINAGIDACVFNAKAGLEHASVMPSFTSYITAAMGGPLSGDPLGRRDLTDYGGVVDVSFPKGS